MHEINTGVKGAEADIIDATVFATSASQKLFLLTVEVYDKRGAVLHYEHPPAHQIDTPALEIYAAALERIEVRQDELSFLIFSFAPDPVHAGGDLKETLANLERGKDYRWAEQRLLKAFDLYKRVRALAMRMRIASVLGGGDYYGGSAEIALWADRMIGDSRSSICMSETTIGLIPGWGGIARLTAKAGLLNVRCLVETARKTGARELKAIGVLDEVVKIPVPLPEKSAERERRQHARDTLPILLARAFVWAAGKIGNGERVRAGRLALMDEHDLRAEVERRSDPYTYCGLWGKPIAEAKEASSRFEAPLAPQSITALAGVFAAYEMHASEERLVQIGMELDAALYRDPRLREGIRAALNKRVADFRQKEEESR